MIIFKVTINFNSDCVSDVIVFFVFTFIAFKTVERCPPDTYLISDLFISNLFFAPIIFFYMRHCNYEKLKPRLIKIDMEHVRDESKEQVAYE